jgi:RNA polymerase sigma-70 factor (ECF subfamily)
MPDTSCSLLKRLSNPPDDEAWRQFVELYTPLIHGWLGRRFLPAAETDDLTQDVLGVVVRELPRFEHNGQPGAFRLWLRTITVHRLRDYWRSRRHRQEGTGDPSIQDQLDRLQDPSSDLSRQWDQEYNRHVVRSLLEQIRPGFKARTWQAFHAVVLQGEPPATVAVRLNTSVNAILLAKSRVLHRLRQAAEGLVE